MISFISGTLLKEKPEWDTTCVIIYYLRNKKSMPNMELFQINIFISLNKICKINEVV